MPSGLFLSWQKSWKNQEACQVSFPPQFSCMAGTETSWQVVTSGRLQSPEHRH